MGPVNPALADPRSPTVGHEAGNLVSALRPAPVKQSTSVSSEGSPLSPLADINTPNSTISRSPLDAQELANRSILIVSPADPRSPTELAK